MGFVRANVLPMLKEHRLRPFSGRCLCLGQADVYFSYENLQRMARIAGISLKADVPVTLSHRPDLAAKNYISRETLFQSIGFSEVAALDYSCFEGAEHVFDLNTAALPDQLHGNFDVVIDHGTLEHIFHIPNCLANIHRMLREGGRVIHSAPSSNFIDHGFYLFSPTLYYDFYTANHWEISTIQVSQLDPQRQEIDPPFFADYEPGILDQVSSGGLGDKAYGTFCIAVKTPESTGDIIPQQGYYARQLGWDPGARKHLAELTGGHIIELRPPYRNEQGYCWVITLQGHELESGDSSAQPGRSVLRLFEDDNELGPAHSPHDRVRAIGRGAYSHWQGNLRFSSHDNSDPNTNGRKYCIYIQPAGG